jgi:putative Ca2+/H+ antiporter (TMEM165/GDT1 family)
LTLVLALKFGARVTLSGSLSALAVQSLACVTLGWELKGHILASTLQFCAAALYTTFAISFASEAATCDDSVDFFQQSVEEVEEELQGLSKPDAEQGLLDKKQDANDYTHLREATTANAEGLLDGVPSSGKLNQTGYEGFFNDWIKIFFFMLVGEMGDKTQFAMIGLSGSFPPAEVFLGSISGFALSCLSAVLCARIVASYGINQRNMLLLVTLSFVVFAVLTMHEAVQSRHEEIGRMHQHSSEASALA